MSHDAIEQNKVAEVISELITKAVRTETVAAATLTAPFAASSK